jgi:trk system potassium uptake protein TrkA
MPLKSAAVIGLGLFGRSLAKKLAELGAEVMAVDKDEALVEEIKDFVASAITADLTNEKALIDSGVCDAECVVVAIGEGIESSVLITALLQKHGAKKIVARSHSELHARVLSALGAKRTFDPEEEMGKVLAEELYAPDFVGRIRLSTGQEVIEFEAPKPFVGKTVQELQLREKYHLNIIAIKRRKADEENQFEINQLPRPGDLVLSGDVIVAIGPQDAARRFEAVLAEGHGG